MISPRPFQAHQFALLHLLGLLSISRPQDAANSDPSLQDPDFGGLLLPQEVIINAFCYLTEQIHEIGIPPPSLDHLVSDIYHLATTLIPPSRIKNGPGRDKDASKSKARSSSKKGRASTRSPAKRASSSPSVPSTRSLRRSSSRPTIPSSSEMGDSPSAIHHQGSPLASTSMASPEVPTHHPQQPSFKVDGKKADRRKATYGLAERLHINVYADIARMSDDRSDAFFASLLEFRILLGDLNNPNNVAFLDRQSPLGVWLRRSLLTLNTMTFRELEDLLDDILFWGGISDSPRNLEKGILFSVSSAVPSDVDTLKARAENFEQYQDSMLKEDYSKTLDLMTRFFDYETFPLAGGIAANRGMRQHALLNLANFHFLHEEFPAARTAATEGIKVARQASDLVALTALASIMRKITFEEPSDKSEVGHTVLGVNHHDIAGDDHAGHTTPMDLLWDVRFGMATRVPVPALTFDLFRAKALYHHAVNQKTSLSPKERRRERKMALQQGKDPATAGSEAQQKRLRWNRLDSIAWMGTSADLWEELGSRDLASIYRTMASVTKAGDIDPAGGARLSLRCQHARQLARNGLYTAALSVLLAEIRTPETSQMTVRDIQSWQSAVYAVLHLQAERSGNDKLLAEIAKVMPPQPISAAFPRRPAQVQPDNALKIPTVTVTPKDASGLLSDVDIFIQKANKYLPSSALPLAVKAMSFSSVTDGQGLGASYRQAILAVVRVQTAFGTCDRALRILNENWDDIIGADDLELLATATKVKARTLIALVDQAAHEEKETMSAVQWDLKEPGAALTDAAKLLQESATLQSRLGNLKHWTYLLSDLAKLHDRRGDLVARDQVSQQCREAKSKWQAELPGLHREQMDQFERVQFICACASASIAAL